METVLSGVRPTGNLHLGNYFGAVKNFVKMQDEYKCFFFIADYHSLTTHPNPADLNNNVRQVIAEYLACGLDPEKSTIYVQSDLPETAELYLLLNMLAYKGELEKCTTFKDKIRKQEQNINAGLLTYPVLMASDILIHRAAQVPVGKDQEQHLEMTRNYAKRFNHLYNCDVLPEPDAFSFDGELIKIPGLDGNGKMGKSEGPNNAIYLVDEPSVLKKKVMKAKTDAGPTEPNSTKPEEIENLFQLMRIMSSKDTLNHFENAYNDCSIRYGDLKKQLAEDMENFVSPLREKIKDLAQNEEYISKVVKLGADKARASANETLKLVREAIGIRKFY